MRRRHVRFTAAGLAGSPPVTSFRAGRSGLATAAQQGSPVRGRPAAHGRDHRGHAVLRRGLPRRARPRPDRRALACRAAQQEALDLISYGRTPRVARCRSGRRSADVPGCRKPVGVYEPLWLVHPWLGAERTSWLQLAQTWRLPLASLWHADLWARPSPDARAGVRGDARGRGADHSRAGGLRLTPAVEVVIRTVPEEPNAPPVRKLAHVLASPEVIDPRSHDAVPPGRAHGPARRNPRVCSTPPSVAPGDGERVVDVATPYIKHERAQPRGASRCV